MTTSLARGQWLFAALLMPLACTHAATSPSVREGIYAPQSFFDDFTGTALDETKWARVFEERNNGYRRDAWYTRPEAVTVSDGLLRIRTWTEINGTTKTHFTGAVSTGDRPVRSSDPIPTPLFAQRYGHFEARIRFVNTSPGQWSSFWIHSYNMEIPSLQGVRDPRRQGMEMDIIEHTSSTLQGSNYTYPGLTGYQAAIFSGGYGSQSVQQKIAVNNVGADDGFHVYGMSWSPTDYTFFCDGRPVWTVAANTNPPTSPLEEIMILSSEVLGGSGGIGGAGANSLPNGYGALGESSNPLMEVDWVRVRPFKGQIDLGDSTVTASPVTLARTSVPEPAGVAMALGTLLLAARRRVSRES